MSLAVSTNIMRLRSIANLAFYVFAVITVTTLFAMHHWRSKSLFRVGGSIDSPPMAVVFNPFRDRDPERAVDTWLKPGLAGHWDQVRASKTPLEWSAHICSDTTPETLVRWNLKYREDLPEEIMLAYKVDCSNSGGYLFVHVRKYRGEWYVSSFKPSGPEPWDGSLQR
jgi:hypothetical protein